MEGFLIRGWDLILPGWRWPCDSQVGVSTPCGGGGVSTRGGTVFVHGCWICRCMEVFLIRGSDNIILPGWRWLYECQVGGSTPWGAVSTR